MVHGHVIQYEHNREKNMANATYEFQANRALLIDRGEPPRHKVHFEYGNAHSSDDAQ